MTDTEKKTHGGHREGAGRKRELDEPRNVAIAFKVRPSIARQIEEMANDGEKRNAAARRLLLEILESK